MKFRTEGFHQCLDESKCCSLVFVKDAWMLVVLNFIMRKVVGRFIDGMSLNVALRKYCQSTSW